MGASDIHQHLNQFVDLPVYGSVDRLLEALSPPRGDHNLSQVSARPQKFAEFLPKEKKIVCFGTIC